MKWRQCWIEAQGYDWWYYMNHIQEELFKRDTCTVCGKAWRPDRPRYISIFGKVIFGKVRGLVFNDDGKLIGVKGVIDWYNEQIGAYPTGNLDDHLRLVCLNHGDRWPTLIDCFTGCEIQLSSPFSPMKNFLLDIKYWTFTVLRFVKIVTGGLIARGMYYLCRDYMKARKEGRRWPW